MQQITFIAIIFMIALSSLSTAQTAENEAVWIGGQTNLAILAGPSISANAGVKNIISEFIALRFNLSSTPLLDVQPIPENSMTPTGLMLGGHILFTSPNTLPFTAYAGIGPQLTLSQQQNRPHLSGNLIAGLEFPEFSNFRVFTELSSNLINCQAANFSVCTISGGIGLNYYITNF